MRDRKDSATLDLFEAPIKPPPKPRPPKEALDPRICGRWVGWSHIKERQGVRFTWRTVEKILVEKDGVAVELEFLPAELREKILAVQEENLVVDLAEQNFGGGPAEDEEPRCDCGRATKVYSGVLGRAMCSEECIERAMASG